MGTTSKIIAGNTNCFKVLQQMVVIRVDIVLLTNRFLVITEVK